MKKVVASAPGKLMLMGEHAVVFDRPCLVTAVDQRMRVEVETLETDEFWLEAPDVKVANYRKKMSELGEGNIPKGAKFVEVAVRNFMERIKSPQPPLIKGAIKLSPSTSKMTVKLSPSLLKRGEGRFLRGLKIVTKSEFSSQFGFGSSSSSTVCVIKALSGLFEIHLNEKQIFDLAYKTVLDIQGKGSGFDVAAAVYGGTLYFVTGGKVIERLDAHDLTLVVGYSGIKADTVTLMKRVSDSFEEREARLREIYDNIGKLVDEGRECLDEKNWKGFGKLLNKNQNYLKELGVSIPKLDKMNKAALRAGAFGAKLSGAGGGDCMIAVSDDSMRGNVQSAIEKAGGEILRVKANAEGVRIE